MRYCQACHRCYNDGIDFCLIDQTPTCEVEHLPIVIEGKYRLEQLIAHGGMGAVFRATHLQLERGVALKILRPELLSDPKINERFDREARAAARLKHPNIIAIYDYGRLPGKPPAPGGAYLVMELVEGRSLREEMQTCAARHGQMRRERAVALIAQACAGVEAAHRRGIIHRDLKPDNIMIEADTGGGERVKVLDFGIAKLRDPEPVWQSLTDEGMFLGTPSYISPEQCSGLAVDARSDLYSLGVMLYEMLAGQVPFGGQSPTPVLLRHLQEPPAPLSRLRPDIGGCLEQVVLRALAKNPSQRYDSVAQFAEQALAALHADAADAPAEVATIDRRLPARGVGPRLIPFNLETPAARRVEREPTLFVEPRPRRGLRLGVGALMLLAGLCVYHLSSRGPDREPLRLTEPSPPAPAPSAREEIVASAQGVVPTPWPVLSPQLIPTRASQAEVSTPTPASLIVRAASPRLGPGFEALKREVQSIYAAWAITAARGDLAPHMGFYADRVEYYRDGVISRAKVEARKRRILSGLDAVNLRFAETPSVFFKTYHGEPEADLIFDKQWELSKGERRAEGKARTLITLRRNRQGWHIVGERQLKLYYNKTRAVKPRRKGGQ